jgi:hypothetical protein
MSSKKPVDVVVGEGEKFCPSCQTVKPVAMFGLSPRLKDGYRNYCKACDSAASKKSVAKRKAEAAGKLAEVTELEAELKAELVALGTPEEDAAEGASLAQENPEAAAEVLEAIKKVPAEKKPKAKKAKVEATESDI